MIEPEKRRRYDVVAALAFLGLGFAVIIAALGMPLSGTYAGAPIYWYTSPAFFPLILGVLLMFCAAASLRTAVAAGGAKGLGAFLAKEIGAIAAGVAGRRAAFATLLLAGYVTLLSLHPFGRLGELLGRIPGIYSLTTRFLVEPEGANYVVSSALSLSAMFWAFHGRRPVWMATFALLASWAVGWAFAEKLYAPLPWLDW